MNEVRRFELYVSHVWPVQRKIVARQISKRCKKCILSEAYVTLEWGLCPECQSKQSKGKEKYGTDELKKQFAEIIQSNQKKGPAQYDALALFSGGKDSTYMLHKIRQDFPDIRLLALSVDNGFMSPVALENIFSVIKLFDIDHLLYRPENNFYEKLYRFALTHLGQAGAYEIVDRLGGDALHDIGRNMAARMDIPLLLSGISPAQVERILNLNTFESPREKERETRVHSAGFALGDIFKCEERLKYWWNGKTWPEEKIPRVLFPFYAWGYDESEIKKEVVKLGLISEKKSSPIVTNNILMPLLGVLDIKRLGYSSFEPEFAQLIREGKADREKWLHTFEFLEYAAKKGKFINKAVDEALEKVSLTRGAVGL